jgi:hypothetical protein
MRLPETLSALPVTLRDWAYRRITREFASVVDHAFDAVWLTNRDGAIVAWQFESEIALCCKLLKTQANFFGWEAGIRTRSKPCF